MGAVQQDLHIEQGVTWTGAWITQVNGAYLDITKWQARSQVRSTVGDPVILHTFTATVTQQTIDTVVVSVVSLFVLPEDSSTWLWRRGVYDCEIFDTSDPSVVVRILQGAVIVSAEVTR